VRLLPLWRDDEAIRRALVQLPTPPTDQEANASEREEDEGEERHHPVA
jgi:hypothetical protein